jgi:hypothetical protein
MYTHTGWHAYVIVPIVSAPSAPAHCGTRVRVCLHVHAHAIVDVTR